MVRVRFRDATTWKYAILAISKIIEEASFKISEEGIKLRAMDPSGVALVDFYIPSEAFSEYDVKYETILTTSIGDLARILRRARRGDELVLEIEADKLGIVFEGKGKRTFILPSLESTYQELPEISFEETFKCRMLPRVFKDTIRELEPISDAVELYAPGSSDVLYVKAQGEIAEAEITLSQSSGAIIEYESTGEARSKYTIGYLIDITIALPVSDVLDLGFGVETPLRMTYELPLGGKLQFYVAPRTD